LLPPNLGSSKEYFKDEHADRLELEEKVKTQNIFNFKASSSCGTPMSDGNL